MAMEVLQHHEAVVRAKGDVLSTLLQEMHHDLESFLWVLVCAIYKHEIAIASRIARTAKRAARRAKAAEDVSQLRDSFGNAYALVSYADVRARRAVMLLKNGMPHIPAGPLLHLVQSFRVAVARRAIESLPATSITHDEILGMFGRCVTALGTSEASTSK